MYIGKLSSQDLVQWAVDDRHRQLAKQTLVRHSYSGQNTSLNSKHQVKLQTMRKAHLDQQKKKIEQEVRLVATEQQQ